MDGAQPPNLSATATGTVRLAVVACLDCGDDRLEVLQREDDYGGTLDQAKRHARRLARTLANRRCASVNVQVLDRENGGLLHDEHAVAGLGPVAEALIEGIEVGTRRTILAGIAAGLDVRAIVRQLRGCA